MPSLENLGVLIILDIRRSAVSGFLVLVVAMAFLLLVIRLFYWWVGDWYIYVYYAQEDKTDIFGPYKSRRQATPPFAGNRLYFLDWWRRWHMKPPEGAQKLPDFEDPPTGRHAF